MNGVDTVHRVGPGDPSVLGLYLDRNMLRLSL